MSEEKAVESYGEDNIEVVPLNFDTSFFANKESQSKTNSSPVISFVSLCLLNVNNRSARGVTGK